MNTAPSTDIPEPQSSRECAYAFDDYLLVPANGYLLHSGQKVALNPRAFDVLTALVAAAGSVVSTQQLLLQVWRSRDVTDANLRVQVSTLRKLFEALSGARRYIDSVAGKGYCFVAPVQQRSLAAGGGEAPSIRAATTVAIPAATLDIVPAGTGYCALIGRKKALDDLQLLLRGQRFVSLVGPGGVGKTALACALIQRLSEAGLRQHIVDFSVPDNATLASLDVGLQASALADLYVLENCEFQIEQAAALAEALCVRAPRALVLAVSRESLLIRRETIYRLHPLALPDTSGLSMAEARHFPAVALFCMRVQQHAPAATLSNVQVPELIELCAALDGLPLALELAAARAARSDIGQLLSQCRAQPAASTPAAAHMARQQSMWHSLDWSFRRLTLCEQAALCRLAVFRGSFGYLSVSHALVCAGMPETQVLDTLQSLVTKSFLIVEPHPRQTLYRLLNSTRAFALERQPAHQAARGADRAPLQLLPLAST